MPVVKFVPKSRPKPTKSAPKWLRKEARTEWQRLLALLEKKLEIADETFDPETCHHLEVVTSEMILPREAMGLGDVKFMAAIGAFLGWQAALFALMFSSVIGAFVGVLLIALRRREWSARLPYGPYIALAAIVWMFGGNRLVVWWWSRLAMGP